jgi:hypothetical protein
MCGTSSALGPARPTLWVVVPRVAICTLGLPAQRRGPGHEGSSVWAGDCLPFERRIVAIHAFKPYALNETLPTSSRLCRAGFNVPPYAG